MSHAFKVLGLGLFLLSSSLSLAVGQSGNDSSLKPGSPAPKLDVKTWFKGTPVAELATDKTYVIEFWATWCGPCVDAIPHVTELAKKYKDVSFIGVGVWEDDVDGKIKAFIEKMGDKMDYNVGYSGNQTGMSLSWLRAAGQNGIPCSFIVNKGVVEWIGHPMSLDKPLEEVVAGTFDRANSIKEFDAEKAREAKAMKIEAELAKIDEIHTNSGVLKAKAALKTFKAKNPEMIKNANQLEAQWMLYDDFAGWKKKVDQSVATKDEGKIVMMATDVLQSRFKATKKPTKGDPMAYLLKATKESNVLLLYYGSIYYMENPAVALKYVDKALALVEKNKTESNKMLKDSLEKLKTQIGKK